MPKTYHGNTVTAQPGGRYATIVIRWMVTEGKIVKGDGMGGQYHDSYI